MPDHHATISFTDDSGRLSPEQLAAIARDAAACLRYLRLQGDVRVRIVSDDEMARLHLEYLDVPGTTDVLTFDMSDPPTPTTPSTDGQDGDEMVIGPERTSAAAFLEQSEGLVFGLDTDIVVCHDEALRRSRPVGYAVERELLLYVVHGVLHCLGWDDHDEAAAAWMHRAEDEVLTAIGVGPVYGLPPSPGT